MKVNEANKIIAEYMGEEIVKGLGIKAGRVSTRVDPSAYYIDKFYSESLDSLIPVWDQLRCYPNFYRYKAKYQCCFTVGFTETSDTLTQAAAIATAKAILELTS